MTIISILDGNNVFLRTEEAPTYKELNSDGIWENIPTLRQNNSWSIPTEEYDPETEFLQYTPDEHIKDYGIFEKKKISEIGVFYNKYTAEKIENESIYSGFDCENFTQIEPPQTNDGDIILFDEELNNWVFDVKSEATSISELLAIKQLKILELNANYIAAQKINIVNGHSFAVSLMGDDFRDIERQVQSANILGKAKLIALDTTGVLQILDIPYEIWLSFYMIAKEISVSNLALKTSKTTEIINTATVENLNNIDINPFPAIETIHIEL